MDEEKRYEGILANSRKSFPFKNLNPRALIKVTVAVDSRVEHTVHIPGGAIKAFEEAVCTLCAKKLGTAELPTRR